MIAEDRTSYGHTIFRDHVWACLPIRWYGGNLTAYEEAVDVEQEAARRIVRACPTTAA